MVSVEKGVSLEVLDWGGNGRPLRLADRPGRHGSRLSDDFAPKLTASYRVYGITRRGRGASSAPEPNAATIPPTGWVKMCLLSSMHCISTNP